MLTQESQNNCSHKGADITPDQIISFPDREINFEYVPMKKPSSKLEIQNNSYETLLFRMKASNEQNFMIIPSFGVLSPFENKTIRLYINGQSKNVENRQQDKILLEVTKQNFEQMNLKITSQLGDFWDQVSQLGYIYTKYYDISIYNIPNYYQTNPMKENSGSKNKLTDISIQSYQSQQYSNSGKIQVLQEKENQQPQSVATQNQQNFKSKVQNEKNYFKELSDQEQQQQQQQFGQDSKNLKKNKIFSDENFSRQASQTRYNPNEVQYKQQQKDYVDLLGEAEQMEEKNLNTVQEENDEDLSEVDKLKKQSQTLEYLINQELSYKQKLQDKLTFLQRQYYLKTQDEPDNRRYANFNESRSSLKNNKDKKDPYQNHKDFFRFVIVALLSLLIGQALSYAKEN